MDDMKELDVSYDGKYVIVTGDDDIYYHISTDYGETFSSLSFSDSYAKGCCMSKDGKHIAISAYHLHISHDYGTTWTARSDYALGRSNKLKMSSNGKYILSGSEISKDYGVTVSSTPNYTLSSRYDPVMVIN